MKITDDMLSAQAAEARELWLQVARRMRCLSTVSPEIPARNAPSDACAKHFAAFNRSLRLARRTAAVLLLSAAVSFGCAMSVEAYRVSLINTVARVFNDLTDYRFLHRPCRPKPTARRSALPVLSGLPDTMHKPMSAAHLSHTVTYESTYRRFST